MQTITIGVIGVGRIGRLHIENIRRFIPGVDVKAISDIYADLDAIGEEFGIKGRYRDYRDVLADPAIEAVLIASSTDTHAEIAIAAAQAGKQIFCEKPVDPDPAKILEVIEAVKKAGVRFQVGFNRRFDHNFRKARQKVEDGTIGAVHVVRVTSRDPAPPPIDYVKVSGGLFCDMMIHDFDMVRYLSGSEPVEIYASGAVLVDPAIGEAGDVDTAAVLIKFENGAIGIIDNSRQAVYGYDQRVEVFGSKGQAVAYNDKPTTVEVSTKDSVTTDKIPFFFLDRYTGAFVDQFKSFFEAVRSGAPTEVDEIDGLRSVEMALAATESYKTGLPQKM